MERTDRRVVLRTMIIGYMLVYAIAATGNHFLLTTLIKPGATILAYFAIENLLRSSDQNKYRKAISLMKRALLLWITVDIVSAATELLVQYGQVRMDNLYALEAGLYIIVRIVILCATIRFYLTLTEKYNRFQQFADFFTIICCITSSMWIIFFSSNSAESIRLMLTLDYVRIFSEIYKLVAMLTLGAMLISWFHYQNMKITLGQRYLISGIALMSGMDLAASYDNLLLDSVKTDVIYKLAIILIAVGCEMYWLHPSRTFLLKPKSESERIEISWMNTGYLLSYPLFVVYMVGLRTELVMFVFVYAFYIIACRYTRQINITDQLLMNEKEKNEKLQLYSCVLEQSPLSIMITDVEGNIEYVNPYFTENTGYTQEEVIGKNPRFLKSDKTPPETHKKLWDCITKGDKWIGEFVNLNKDGFEYLERAIISPIKGEEDRVSHYVGIKEDITEARKLQHVIENQSQFITQLADVIPNSIFHVDKDDIFVEANAEFNRVYEVDTTLYRGVRFEETPWMNPKKLKDFIDMREESIRIHQPVIRQIIRNANGKETPVLYCINAYYTAEGSVGGYIGVMTDISELKEKEAELQNALVRANAATEAKSLFLANMSHEIRTPMNAVMGMAYLALKTELTEKQRDYIMKINNAATSLLGIINDILDFSKIESGKITMEKVNFDLDEVITKSVELLVQKARSKNLEFNYRRSWNVPALLKGDPLRLGQIITNLVSNAVKFTEEGEIRVDIVEERRIDRCVCLKFSIADTGIGIPKENQSGLFDAFTQSDSSITRQYGGTGLGLAICRRLVEMMEGEIWIESEPNQGSTFFFTAWFDMPDEKNRNKRLTLPDIREIKTLIVDDNSAAREILKEYMENMGFVAEVAVSGSQAIEMLQSCDLNNPYKLLLIDWKMPHLDGVQTVKRISSMKTLQNKPSVVLVTAYDTQEMKKHAEEVKIDAFLSKPVTQSSLYDSIVTIYADTFQSSGENVPGETEYHTRGMRILLAEDNEMNQQIACELLEGQGCIVDLVNNGREAVEHYQNNPEAYDVILMDIQMPEMDGIEATVRIREQSKEIPILAMTARSMKEEIEKCFKAGMNGHIAKPIDPRVLLSNIEKWNKYVENEEVDTYSFIEEQTHPEQLTDLVGEEQELVHNLLRLLEKGDVAAVGYYEENKRLLQQVIQGKSFEQLAAGIAGYDFDHAISILAGLGIGGIQDEL